MSCKNTATIKGILRGIFDMAVRDDSIKSSPMLKVNRPQKRKDDNTQPESEKALSAEELQKILTELGKVPLKWRTYITLAVDTGARRGELCGIKWEDVDWSTGAITFSRNLQYTSTAGVYVAKPKNGRTRVVDVGQETLDLLRQLRAEQASSCICEWVFSQDGTPDPMHPQRPTAYFAKFGKKYGIKNFHPHLLRHTAASIAILNGADVVSVSQRLGHSDPAVTLRMYAHANQESIRRAGQVVRDVLNAVNK